MHSSGKGASLTSFSSANPALPSSLLFDGLEDAVCRVLEGHVRLPVQRGSDDFPAVLVSALQPEVEPACLVGSPSRVRILPCLTVLSPAHHQRSTDEHQMKDRTSLQHSLDIRRIVGPHHLTSGQKAQTIALVDICGRPPHSFPREVHV